MSDTLDKPAAQPDAQPDADPVPKPVPNFAAQPDGNLDAQPETQPNAQPETQPDLKPAAHTDAHRDTHPDAQPTASLDPWTALRRYTPARIALGRSGASLPTTEVLDFQMAHARARDAVHLPLDAEALTVALDRAGFKTLRAWSMAADRRAFVLRPDLGRRLHPDCRASLAATGDTPRRLSIVVADGLSALAPARHALPLLEALRCEPMDWTLDAIVIATQARVALADEVGRLRAAEAVVILLGERPGLGAPDSLGIYLTYAPQPGRSDAERNCISNVRAEGLSYAEAAYKLHYLLTQARAAGQSGTAIKDSSHYEAPTLGKLAEPAPRIETAAAGTESGLEPPKPFSDDNAAS